jgi:hypothetical protein
MQAEPYFCVNATLALTRRSGTYQRPKNSHNNIITGIGTPTSHSRIPRPMFASLNPQSI